MAHRVPQSLVLNDRFVGNDGMLTQRARDFLNDVWRLVVPGFILIPVDIGGTANAITLTATEHELGSTMVHSGMAFVGRATLSSTGSVTATLGDLGPYKVYKNAGASQAGNADIVLGSVYIFIFNEELDSAAGGLVAIGLSDLSAIYQPLDADLTAVAASGVAGAWTAYVPTITSGTGAFTTVSATGRYLQIGKTVFVQITITDTTNGTAATSTKATLPVAASGAIFVLAGRNQTSGSILQGNIAADVDNVYIRDDDNAYSGADGQVLAVSGIYEAA